MKITCQSCQAKYTIADEKVVGKTVKIKCKKCGAAIVVNANDPMAAAADPHGPAPEAEEDDGTTRVFSGDSPAGPDWTVNVRDDDQRTMSAAQIAQAFAAGTITADTYVWRDGMADWQPLGHVAELQAALAAPAPRPAAGMPAAAAPATSDDDLNATVAMNPEAAAAHYAPAAAAPAAAAAAPAAARKAGRAGQDLFGAGGGSPFDGGGAPAVSPSTAPPKMSGGAVGERNENSVLFSLASLTATEKAAAAQDTGPKKKTGGRSGLDDIMNIGGGGGMGGAMLAPPPIMAPVIEPPPQQIAPQPVAPMAAMPMGGSVPPPGTMPASPMGAMNPMMSYPPPAQKKTPVGLIVGIVVGVLALAGVGIFLATSGGDKTAENGTTADSAGTTATQTAAPTTTAAPKPTETVAANTAAATNTAAPAGGDPGTTTKSTSGGTAPAGTGTGKPSGTAPTAATTTQPSTPPPTATATAETPPSGGGAEFNRAAASSALNGAAGAARGCKKPDGPTGTAKVKVTFAPSGSVTQSVVQGAPFAGTPVGSCIAGAFRGAKVPPFEGSPVSVTKSVTIN